MATRLLQQGDALEDVWVIRALIGSGSFGLVYSALDRHEHHDVAVKTLLPSAARAKDLVARFEREAEICAQLSHPNTAQFRHFGTYEVSASRVRVPFMVFDLVYGLPLGKLLDVRDPLSVEETCVVLIQVLESLGEAHSLGIIHRDLKPDNIMAVAPEDRRSDPDYTSRDLCQILGIPGPKDPTWHDLTKLEIKVLDFGLGKILEIGERRVKALTAAGVAPGTAHYMSPELARGEEIIDYRADIYGVAMLLHKLLTGKETYRATTAVEVSMAHAVAPLPKLPAPFDNHPITEIFERGGAKDPRDRYSSAAEMQWALQCVLDPDMLSEEPPDFASPPEVRAKRKGLFARMFGR